MNSIESGSIPIVYRHHRRLWRLNRETLFSEMREAAEGLRGDSGSKNVATALEINGPVANDLEEESDLLPYAQTGSTG